MVRIFILAALVCVAFGNSLFNNFVWDDGSLIVENPYIKSFKFFPKLFSGDLFSSANISYHLSGYYRPLSMASFMLDYRLWGLNPFGYHLTNIFIHLLNSILVFLILSAVSQNRKFSFLASLFFCVHPIHVEAVAPVYNRMGIQSAFFVLLGFFYFIKSQDFNKKVFLFGALISFFLGLLSKEDAIILPLIFILYDYYYLSGLEFKNLFQRKKIVFYVSCVALGLLYLLVRNINSVQSVMFPFFDKGELAKTALAPNISYHMLTIFKILGGYISKVVLPMKLSPVYWIDPVNSIGDRYALLSLVIVIVLIWLIFYLGRKAKDISFFMAFFLVSLLPVANVIPFAKAYSFCERFLYVPSISMCFILAFLLYALRDFHFAKNFKTMLMILPFTLIVLMGTSTIAANYVWRDNLSLWRYAVDCCPRSQIAHLNLGQALASIGRYDEAVIELKKSMTDPTFKALDSVYLAQLDLASIYIEEKQYPQALSTIQQAIGVASEIPLNPSEAYDKLGLFYANVNDKRMAEENFKRALTYHGNSLTTMYNLGVLYYTQGDDRKAEEQFVKILSLDPDFQYAKSALHLIYRKQKR